MLRIVNMGKVDYGECLMVQQKLQKLRILDQCDDTLLLLEHPPVLTKGTRTIEENILLSEEELAEKGVSIYETNRGGDVTYHGPGQIVGYIIMHIDGKNRDIRQVIKKLAQVTVNILKNEFNIEGYSDLNKYTGVFVDENKITAVGIGVNRRVTMHGFAMNVNTNLSHFDWIVPCGLKDRGVTSIEKLTGRTYDIGKMKQLIRHEFETLYDTPTYEISKEQLYNAIGEEYD
ncbi:MAG: lipoyl(octanoyl) transferase LipB [Vallitaleaceae bacterium]|jgi:lipoyl(octanoyl) transferase|nr:lipoyl(octanoyl) transferase LipB [Vallitaleaceae bacterium]